jgi:hypothetical protein
MSELGSERVSKSVAAGDDCGLAAINVQRPTSNVEIAERESASAANEFQLTTNPEAWHQTT